VSLLQSDTFVRADNADIGTNWTPASAGTSGGWAFAIVSNKTMPANSGIDDACEGWSGNAWPNDQWAESTLGGVSASGVGIGTGAAVRVVTGDSTHYNLYRLVANGSGYELAKFINGTFTSLGSGSGTTFATGDRVYLEFQGTTPVGKKNTTNGSGGVSFGTFSTDSGISAGNSGISYSSTDATTSITAWAGGDFLNSPTINTQPVSQTCYVGQTSTFTISATTSGGTLHYQWKDDGSNVGTDSSSYTTATAVLTDANSLITCVVSDDNGSTTSSTVIWYVLNAAQIAWTKA